MGGSVSSLLDPRGRGVIIVPDGYQTPDFPSLYLPSFVNTRSEIGVFLYEAENIWRFTIYWTLLLVGGTFLLCSLFASFTLLLSLTTYRQNAAPPQKPPDPREGTYGKRAHTREKRKRPPFWPLIVLPFFWSAVAALVALVSGSVVGFALAAVYSAGGFTMSTLFNMATRMNMTRRDADKRLHTGHRTKLMLRWVPFLWALIQVIVLVISSYSTLTSVL